MCGQSVVPRASAVHYLRPNVRAKLNEPPVRPPNASAHRRRATGRCRPRPMPYRRASGRSARSPLTPAGTCRAPRRAGRRGNTFVLAPVGTWVVARPACDALVAVCEEQHRAGDDAADDLLRRSSPARPATQTRPRSASASVTVGLTLRPGDRPIRLIAVNSDRPERERHEQGRPPCCR